MNRSFIKIPWQLILLITSIIFISCKATKHVKNELQDPNIQLYHKIKDTSIDYDWYSAKAKVRIESSEINGSGRMNIRMVRDSIIWFNFKKVSIEGARGVIDSNGFTIIYRTEKKYEKGFFEDLFNEGSIPISFEEIQSFLVGSVPLPFESTIEYSFPEKLHSINGKNESYHLRYTFDDELKLIEYIMTPDQNRKLVVQLDKFDEELGIYKNRKLSYYQNNHKTGALEMDFSNIEIDIPKKMPFSIPGHYTKF